MSITVAPLKLKGATRQEVLAQIGSQIQQAVAGLVAELIMAFLEAEVEAQLGRAKYAARTVSSQPRPSQWQCGFCGNNDANKFSRDGHYKRSLETSYGHLSQLQVPMLECQLCQHDVVCQWTILAKWQRFWWDFTHQVVAATALGQSLRQLRDEWSSKLGGAVGLSSINRHIATMEQLACRRHLPLSAVPEVVQLDGIWFNLMQPTGELVADKGGRLRPERQVKRRVLLVALGLWADGTGRREILDWQLAEAESEEAWTILLQRLWEGGLTAQGGLKLVLRDGGTGLGQAFDYVYSGEVVEQRCIFHKLHNLSRHFKRGVSQRTDPVRYQAQSEQRHKLMQEASQIYAAENAEVARQRLAAWAKRWQGEEARAVQNLQEEFEQTLGYYQLEGIEWRWIRTTSLLERTNRELRRKFRQVGSWGSKAGAEVGIYLQIERLNASWKGYNWQTVSQELCLSLL